MIDLSGFKKNSIDNGLCTEYTTKWNGCKTKKQLMDLALGIKGVDYICDSIAKGWGISPEYLSSNFSNFINGNYTVFINGYSSKMYCGFFGNITADTSVLTLINCDVCVYVPDNRICDIYITGKCNITISGNGESVLVCYGNPDDIKVTGQCRYMKMIHKKERDRHE